MNQNTPLLYDHNGNPITMYVKPATKLDKFAAAFFATLGFLVVGALVWSAGIEVKRHYWPEAKAFDSLTRDEWPSHPFIATWPYAQKELDASLRLWEKETGIKIPAPVIWLGNCFTENALACANREKGTITFTSASIDSSYDMRSVMLHEVGHLYGVPHIEGDDLMSPSGAVKVKSPTPFAVAIAKIAASKGK